MRADPRVNTCSSVTAFHWLGALVLSVMCAIACSGDALTPEGHQLLARMRTPLPFESACLLQVESTSVRGIVKTVRCIITDRRGRATASWFLLPDRRWKVGYDVPETMLKHYECLRERHVFLGRRDGELSRLARHGRLSSRGQYALFQVPVRSAWGVWLGEYERGVELATGRTCWTAYTTSEGYASFWATFPVRHTEALKRIQGEELVPVYSQSEVDGFMCVLIKGVPELLVAAPYLSRCMRDELVDPESQESGGVKRRKLGEER